MMCSLAALALESGPMPPTPASLPKTMGTLVCVLETQELDTAMVN